MHLECLVKQKLAETSELIRSKLEALSVEAEYLNHLSDTHKEKELEVDDDIDAAVERANAEEEAQAARASPPVVKAPLAEKSIRTEKTSIADHLPLPRGRRTHAGHSHKCPQGHNHSTVQDRVPPAKRANAESSSFVDMQTDTNHDTALTLACVGGHASPVELLIKRGADVEHKDKKGFTPLILAATGGHVEVCRILLEAKCAVDAQSERTKDTALSLACSGGRKEVRYTLLPKSPSYNIAPFPGMLEPIKFRWWSCC